jgi:oxygen-dependent protoporphyrinogen oxidase
VRVAVIGAGIAGLTAAYELTGADPALEVSVFEPGPLGGKLQTERFAGHAVDLGPDAFLTRTPDAVELCRRLGLGPELVAPAAAQAMLWTRGRLRPLPEGLILGVPARLAPVLRSGVLSPWGSLRAALDLVLPKALPADLDCTVAELIGSRFGQEVLDRLVDPLIGGIHAGRTDELSLAATVPQLQEAYRQAKPSLLMALRANRDLARRGPGTVGAAGGAPAGDKALFMAPKTGMARLVERLVEELSARRVQIVERSVATLLPAGTTVTVVGGADGRNLGTFDGVVLAVPPAATAELLAPVCPVAGQSFKAVPTASVTMVTLAYPAEEVKVPRQVSGFLVPRRDGHLITACSFGSHKWRHWSDPDIAVLRVSAGRCGDERASRLADEDIVHHVSQELSWALGRQLGPPLDQRITRWRGAFPQYLVGHLQRVDRAETALAAELPNLVLAGAALRGSGIPACIGSAQKAVASLLERLSGPAPAR